MTTGRVRWTLIGWAIAALALAGTASPATAQQSRDDCRCVDADGNAISDCTCFRTPSFDAMAFTTGLDRPRLGIRVDAEQGSALDAQGAEVTDVLEDGPAWEAGLRAGDVITAIDGRSLFQPLGGDAEAAFDLDRSVPVQRLLAIARDLEPGDDVEVTYLRGGEERTATLTAEELSGRALGYGYAPALQAERLRDQLGNLRDLPRFQWQGADGRGASILEAAPGPALFFGGSSVDRYGLELVELNEGLGSYFGTDEGVLVLNVAADSELALRPGDVIRRIGDREATTPERALRILASYGADEDIPLHIRRGGREMSVLGRLPD